MNSMPENNSPYRIVPLVDLLPGSRGTVVSVPDNPLMYPLSLRPGKELLCLGHQLFGGPVLVKTGDRQVALSRRLAAEVLVRLLEGGMYR